MDRSRSAVVEQVECETLKGGDGNERGGEKARDVEQVARREECKNERMWVGTVYVLYYYCIW